MLIVVSFVASFARSLFYEPYRPYFPDFLDFKGVLGRSSGFFGFCHLGPSHVPSLKLARFECANDKGVT